MGEVAHAVVVVLCGQINYLSAHISLEMLKFFVRDAYDHARTGHSVRRPGTCVALSSACRTVYLLYCGKHC